MRKSGRQQRFGPTTRGGSSFSKSGPAAFTVELFAGAQRAFGHRDGVTAPFACLPRRLATQGDREDRARQFQSDQVKGLAHSRVASG